MSHGRCKTLCLSTTVHLSAEWSHGKSSKLWVGTSNHAKDSDVLLEPSERRCAKVSDSQGKVVMGVVRVDVCADGAALRFGYSPGVGRRQLKSSRLIQRYRYCSSLCRELENSDP